MEPVTYLLSNTICKNADGRKQICQAKGKNHRLRNPLRRNVRRKWGTLVGIYRGERGGVWQGKVAAFAGAGQYPAGVRRKK